MKKIVFTAIVLLSMSTFIFAQGPARNFSPEEIAKRNTERMKTELKLTDDQVVKVDSINLTLAKKQAELFQNGKEDRLKMRENAQKLTAEREAAYEEVLTKEQLDAYKKSAQERKSRGGGGPRRGGK
jgi:hypothetical protein